MTEADQKIVSFLADDLEALAIRNSKRTEQAGSMPVQLEDLAAMENKVSEVVELLREHGIGVPRLTALVLDFNPPYPNRLEEVVNELRLAIR